MTHLFEGHRLPKKLTFAYVEVFNQFYIWMFRVKKIISQPWLVQKPSSLAQLYFLLTFLFVCIYWCLLMFHAKCNLWPFLPAYRHWFNKPILSSQTKRDNIQSCKDKEKQKDKASMIMSLMHELCWWNNLCCSTTLLFHNWARDWSCSGENNTFTAFYSCFWIKIWRKAENNKFVKGFP